MTYDYADYKDAEPAVPEDVLGRLSKLAGEQLRAEAAVEHAGSELKAATERLRHIRENQIPQLMEQVGMEEFTTQDGVAINISEIIRGSIPKPNEAEAFAWLEKIDQERLIKRTFTIDFGKEEDGWANKFERDLAQRKKPLNVKRKKAVNPNTLQAFVRERLAEGLEVPMDVLGVFRQRFSKVKVKTRK